MTLAPLLAARDAGYRTGMLQASPMRLPVDERLRFRSLVTNRVHGEERGGADGAPPQ